MVDYSHIRRELYDFAEGIKQAVRMIMESEKGINPKVGQNTLIGSNIYEELEVETHEIGFFTLLVNDYIDAIENGTKPLNGSIFAHTMDIAEWAVRKGLPSDNKSVLAYCGSIYWYGIKARPIMDDAFDALDDYWDGWADMMFERITSLIDDFFSL